MQTQQEDNDSLPKKIKELISPQLLLITEANSRNRLNTIITMGVAAWNYSVTNNQDIINNIIASTKDLKQPKIMERLLKELRDRKEKLFPSDKRIIIDFDIIDTGDNAFELKITHIKT
jgi:hypothetical protein